jgi:hypothetical protein
MEESWRGEVRRRRRRREGEEEEEKEIVTGMLLSWSWPGSEGLGGDDSFFVVLR